MTGPFVAAQPHLHHAKALMPSDEGLPERLKAWETAVEKRDKARREDERRKELDKRDGPMTREQRVERFQARPHMHPATPGKPCTPLSQARNIVPPLCCTLRPVVSSTRCFHCIKRAAQV